MANWSCAKCNVEMEEVEDIKMVYGEVDLPEAIGLRCPQCGAEYLMEDYVVEELANAEQMLEGK